MPSLLVCDVANEPLVCNTSLQMYQSPLRNSAEKRGENTKEKKTHYNDYTPFEMEDLDKFYEFKLLELSKTA